MFEAAYGFFLIAELLVIVCVWCLVQMYAAKEVKLGERLMVGFAWLVCLSIVAVIPMDVHTSLAARNLSWLPYIWRFLYWATFLLTWLILPIHLGYVDAGDFTSWKKLRNSLSFNLYFYISLGSVCFIGVVFVAVLGHMKLSTIMDVSIAASNTFGLFFGVVLLGYGLVEAPRSLWRTSSPYKHLEWYHLHIGQTHTELQEARYKTKKYIMVKNDIAAQLPRGDELSLHISNIERKLAQQLQTTVKDTHFSTSGNEDWFVSLENITVDRDEIDDATLNTEFDEDGLASLRRKLRNAASRMKRLDGKMSKLIQDGIRVSILVGERESLKSEQTSANSILQLISFQINKFFSSEGSRRSTSILLGILSASVIFSETTIATRLSDLSVFSLLIRVTSRPNADEDSPSNDSFVDFSSYLNMSMILFPVAYMCFCSYFSLFKLKMFTFYALSLNQTDAYSLILNASLACRFAAPLCYNYLFMIHMAHGDKNSARDTSFGKLMGSQINNVPFFGVDFNEYFPIVVLLYTATIYFKVFHKAFRMCGIHAYFIDALNDSSIDDIGGGDDEDIIMIKSDRERDCEVGKQILRRHMNTHHFSSVNAESGKGSDVVISMQSKRRWTRESKGGRGISDTSSLLENMDGSICGSYSDDEDENNFNHGKADSKGRRKGEEASTVGINLSLSTKLPEFVSSKSRNSENNSLNAKFEEMKNKLRNKVQESTSKS